MHKNKNTSQEKSGYGTTVPYKSEPNLFRGEILRFIIVGSSAVGTDFTVYFLLLNWLSHDPAKTISFIAGTVVAYVFNKYWTFKQPIHRHAEVLRFVFLYASTLLANVGVNALALHLFPTLTLLAFLAATGTSTILNFVGMKWWVFHSKEHKHETEKHSS